MPSRPQARSSAPLPYAGHVVSLTEVEITVPPVEAVRPRLVYSSEGGGRPPLRRPCGIKIEVGARRLQSKS